jgi:hypothetical protein
MAHRVDGKHEDELRQLLRSEPDRLDFIAYVKTLDRRFSVTNPNSLNEMGRRTSTQPDHVSLVNMWVEHDQLILNGVLGLDNSVGYQELAKRVKNTSATVPIEEAKQIVPKYIASAFQALVNDYASGYEAFLRRRQQQEQQDKARADLSRMLSRRISDESANELRDILRSEIERPLFEMFVEERDKKFKSNHVRHVDLIHLWVECDQLELAQRGGIDISNRVQELVQSITPSSTPRSAQQAQDILIRHQVSIFQALLSDYLDGFEAFALENRGDEKDDFVVGYFGSRDDLFCFSGLGANVPLDTTSEISRSWNAREFVMSDTTIYVFAPLENGEMKLELTIPLQDSTLIKSPDNSVVLVWPATPPKYDMIFSRTWAQGLQPAWDATMARECVQCAGDFNLVRRRHHCRACGNTVCADCSKDTLILRNGHAATRETGGKECRVCDICFYTLRSCVKSTHEVASPRLDLNALQQYEIISPSDENLISQIELRRKEIEKQQILIRSCRMGNWPTVQLMLECNAKRLLFKFTSTSPPTSPLHQAVLSGHIIAIKMLMRKHGAFQNSLVDDKGRSALHYCAMRGIGVDETVWENCPDYPTSNKEKLSKLNCDIILLLLENGSLMNLQTTGGSTPLHLCTVPRTANFLLQHNASIDMADFTGNTALHHACRRRNGCDMVRMFAFPCLIFIPRGRYLTIFVLTLTDFLKIHRLSCC